MAHEVNKLKAEYFARRVQSIKRRINVTGPKGREFYEKEMAILGTFEDIMQDRVFDDEERKRIMVEVDEFLTMVESDNVIDAEEQEAIDVIRECLAYIVRMDEATRASRT